MASQQMLRSCREGIYSAPSLPAAVDVLSDLAVQLGFLGASCVFWPRNHHSVGEMPPPGLRASGRNLGVAAEAWNSSYIRTGMFRSDFVFRACHTTAVPFVWSYDNLPGIVLGVEQEGRIGEALGIERLWKTTGFRGGISVPLRTPGGYFGYVAFVSNNPLRELSTLCEDYSDRLLGIAYHFYEAIADKLVLEEARGRQLTPRQLDCLKLIAIGKTLDEAAEILGLSYSTVRFHLKAAAESLGAFNRANAIRKAASLGLLSELE
ncbi:MAG: hypothetical protein FJ191_01515 [Gammaproteobacteria bacterium]|nr:hypothetical protein [Gammaproteobacteria bacterium]